MHATVDTRHAYVMHAETYHSMYIPTCLECGHSLSSPYFNLLLQTSMSAVLYHVALKGVQTQREATSAFANVWVILGMAQLVQVHAYLYM